MKIFGCEGLALSTVLPITIDAGIAAESAIPDSHTPNIMDAGGVATDGTVTNSRV